MHKHKQNEDYRVVFRHPKHWVAQKHTHTPATRESDPWQDLHGKSEDLDTALRVMYERMPLRTVV